MTELGCAIWLYGSHARGDSDPLSDIDVLMVGDANAEPGDFDSNCLDTYTNFSVSRYTWDELRGMAAYGSLFLQHLRLEGRRLHEDRACSGQLHTLLEGMPSYRLAARDIAGFRVALCDVEASLGFSDTVVYELGVLGTVIRHSSILGCWLLGVPTFSRTLPVQRLVSELGMPYVISEEFAALYRYRLYLDGRSPKPDDTMDPNAWLLRARTVVDAVEHIYDRPT